MNIALFVTENKDHLLKVMQVGAKTCRASFGHPIEFSTKTDGSPVSPVDIEVQMVMIAALTAMFPEYPVISEESPEQDDILLADTFWLLDPLDGTKEYRKKSPEFTINLALVVDERPVLAFIAVPMQQTIYWAAQGRGAYVWNNGQETAIHVSKKAYQQQLNVVESRDHLGINDQKYFHNKRFHRQSVGSALKGCLVASGVADVYVRATPFWSWDVCAQDCLVTNAGGIVTDLQNKLIRYLPYHQKVLGAIISNGVIHQDVFKQL